MRAIKFRGKDFLGRWHYGYLHLATGSSSLMIQVDSFDSFGVLPQTVGQFTGLLDKNGKEIYEGDIIKTRRYGIVNGNCNSQGADKFIVIYMDAQFYIENNLRHFYLQDSKCNEVIGNIYDNPEYQKTK